MIRKAFFGILLLAMIGLWAFGDMFLPSETVRAETATVKDGDTLDLDKVAYRLYGIDAPEYRQTCKDGRGTDWPCGKAARLHLAAMVKSGSLACEPKAEDKYGRKVARCSSTTVPDLAEAMVQAGLAISPAARGTAAYGVAEDSARAAKRGIWQGSFATPADYRAEHSRKDIP
jgi:endonuclease YncB( thermonuclease family)